MPEIVERGACPQEGIGKPDYSKDIARSIGRPGFYLKAKQWLTMSGLTFTNVASPPGGWNFSWIKTPLAPGASLHVIDMATGDAYPYPQVAADMIGYKHTLIQRTVSCDQDVRIDSYMEGPFPLQLGFNMVLEGGIHVFKQDVVGMSTAMFDPDCLLAHRVDTIFTNLGAAPLTGSIADIGILEAVGTEPLPGIKVVVCKWCGHRETVPVETTQLICPQCGKLTLYYSLYKLRQSS